MQTFTISKGVWIVIYTLGLTMNWGVLGNLLVAYLFMRICVCPFCLLLNCYQIVIISLSNGLDTSGGGVLCCSCEPVGGSRLGAENEYC